MAVRSVRDSNEGGFCCWTDDGGGGGGTGEEEEEEGRGRGEDVSYRMLGDGVLRIVCGGFRRVIVASDPVINVRSNALQPTG